MVFIDSRFTDKSYQARLPVNHVLLQYNRINKIAPDDLYETKRFSKITRKNATAEDKKT